MGQNEKRVRKKTLSANLTPEEYFVFSNIGDGCSLKELFSVCPWSEDEILRKLQSMESKGAVEWDNKNSEEEKKTISSEPQTTPQIEDQLQKDASDPNLSALDKNFRREILLKYTEPEMANPYETLGIDPRSSNTDVKARYLALSRKFHPDRFFQKDLGHYKAKLDNIFSRIQKAYALLKKPIEREALDRTLALHNRIRDKTTEDHSVKKPIKLDKDLERQGKAEFLYKKGLEHEKKNEFILAFEAIMEAKKIAPDREQYAKALERIKPHMYRQKAYAQFSEVKKALLRNAATADILLQLDEIVRYDPHLVEAKVYLAKTILDLNETNRFRDAKEMLLRTKAHFKTDGEPCYLLARLAFSLGENKLAEKELAEALEREPTHAAAKKLLSKIKG